MVIIIFYFRMSDLPKVLLEGDSPPAPLNHEDDEGNCTFNSEVAQQLGEAMEDSVTIEIQASDVGGERCAENTANPPSGARMEEERGPFRENTLKDTLGGRVITSGGIL